MTIPALLQVAGHEPLGPKELRGAVHVVVLAGFILEASASGVKASGTAPARLRIARQPVLQGVGVALGTVYSLSSGNPHLQRLLLLSALFCLTAGEIAQRIHFYRSYQRVGL